MVLWDGPKAAAVVVHNIFTHLNKKVLIIGQHFLLRLIKGINNKGGKQILKVAITLIRNLEIQANGKMFWVFLGSWSVYSPLRKN